jgi:hypothetical protein
MKLQFSFLPIPEELMGSDAISWGAKYLFGILAKANKENIRWSIKFLSKRMNCKPRETSSRIAELRKNNLIIVEERSGGLNTYTINLQLIQLVQTHVQTDVGGEGAKRTGGHVRNERGASLLEPLTKEKIKEKTLTPSQEMKLFLEDNQFFNDFAKEVAEKEKIALSDMITQLQRFKSYWSELNKSGKKQKWEMERTFELKRRVDTWLRKAEEFGGLKNDPVKIKSY